ncbi:MAG TPA: O-antigen ligase family protein [Candidatus Limiplasma pullicola]|nr:O-antigen ligase family protein [Candidatus Limiplasma pullicola]
MSEEGLRTRGERRLWNARWLAVTLFALVMLLGLITYERGHALMQSYGAALAFAMTGICLYRGDYRADRIYGVGLALAAWYTLTRALNGDHYLQYDYNQYRIVCMVATYGLAFPLAAMLRDVEKRRALDRVAAVLTAVIAAVCWLGVIAALRGEVITVPFFGSQFGIMEDGRLYVLSQHPNFTAAFSLCGLCMLIYLVVSHWKPWVLIPAAVAGAGLFMALPLSDSRTGMIAFLLIALIAAAIGFQRLPIPAKWRRIVEVVCLVALVAVVAVAGFGAAVKVVSTTSDGEQVISQRSLLADLTTLTGRTGVYGAVPATFAQHPLAMLKGFDELEMMPAVNDNVEMHYNHMHNSFLQTLMLTGVPGLLAALWLTWRVISSGIRVLFAKGSIIRPAQKLLVLLPAALLVQGMLEHYLFVDSYSILNFLFFLFAGYVVQLGRQVSWKQAFPGLARRGKA